jgi:hypothetical protein
MMPAQPARESPPTKVDRRAANNLFPRDALSLSAPAISIGVFLSRDVTEFARRDGRTSRKVKPTSTTAAAIKRTAVPRYARSAPRFAGVVANVAGLGDATEPGAVGSVSPPATPHRGERAEVGKKILIGSRGVSQCRDAKEKERF